MRFETLEQIAILLENKVKTRRASYEKAIKRVRELRQMDEESEEFDKEVLHYWEESKKRRYQLLEKAENALNDFLDQDWR